ncbi:MAG: SDR family oxidoreductase [Melioribacteraceae bacterium]|nr:SDR family oxidoreductase [Melioribacteraceae bacterium]
MNRKTISVLGCGWLGLPLAQRLYNDGYSLKGSTTSVDKLKKIEEPGIEPHLVILNPDVRTDDIQNFLSSKILIVNIPPSRNEHVLELFPAQIKFLINEIEKSPIEKVLFVSSTSVYGDTNKTVTEESELNPERDSGKALVIAEGLLRAEITFRTTILRFGGLVGPNRQPGRFLAGRKNVSGGNAKVNLIHLDDCIEIIVGIIDNNLWGDIFNACADEHPTRKELYTKAAEKLDLETPSFTDDNGNYKIVSSQKLKAMLNYKFKYPNPMEMF